jgi:hypothetical protein
MSNELGYTVTATVFAPDRSPSSASLGVASLIVEPLDLRLDDVLIISMPEGVRVVFARYGVLTGTRIATYQGRPIYARLGQFRTPESWKAFSDAALAAIDKRFPGQLLAVAQIKVLPPRADVAA